MAESIEEKLKRAAKLIQDGSREKSWEWCHQAFLEIRNQNRSGENFSEKDIDYLSLQLGFYLASWGMYRGSSFLLQRDYKVHSNAVKEILKERYNILWNYQPGEKDREANELLFGQNKDGIYWKIKYSYSDDDNNDIATDTLVYHPNHI